MGIEQLDYAAILADLEAKRSALEQTIASFRTALAIGALGQAGDIPPASNGVGGSVYSPLSASGGEVPAGAFLGKSIPDAAKLYLEIVKRKQTSKEIAEALQKGGMESTSRNFQQIVHSVLDRARKANSGIVKLDRSHWGLAEWYPASLRNTVVQDKRTPKKKSNRKKARKVPQLAEGAQQVASPQPPTGTAQASGPTKHEQVGRLLQDNKGKEMSADQIAQHLGISRAGVRLIVGLMVKKGKVEKTAAGNYRAPMPQLAAAG